MAAKNFEQLYSISGDTILPKVQVIDSLTSTDNTKPLAASQGKTLETNIEANTTRILAAHGVVSTSINPSIVEVGKSTTVTVTRKGSIDLPGENVMVIMHKDDDTVDSENNAYTYTTSTPVVAQAEGWQKEFITTVDFKLGLARQTTKTSSEKVTGTWPSVAFTSTLTNATSVNITSAIVNGNADNKKVSLSAAGTYNVTVSGNNAYIYICIPYTKSFNNMRMNGFEVDYTNLENVANVASSNSNITTTYKVYRTTKQQIPGTYKIELS